MVSPLSPWLYFSASVSHGHSTISSSNCPWSWLPGTTYPALFYHWPNCLLRRRQWHPTPVLLLENPMGGGAWWAAVHGVAKSRTRLSDFTFTFHLHALEKEMATHSSVLVWRVPGTGELGRLPSMGLHRVGHDWSDLAAAAANCLLSPEPLDNLLCLLTTICITTLIPLGSVLKLQPLSTGWDFESLGFRGSVSSTHQWSSWHFMKGKKKRPWLSYPQRGS